MKLSERLLDEAEGYGPGPTTFQADEVRQLATLLREAAALAKSVESVQVGAVELDLGCVLRVRAESGQWITPIDGQRVALVPLPQQSES